MFPTVHKEVVDRIPPADDLLVQRGDAEHVRADDHAQKQGGFDHLGAALVARQTCTPNGFVVTLTFASWNLIGRFLRQLDSVRQVA